MANLKGHLQTWCIDFILFYYISVTLETIKKRKRKKKKE